MTPIRFALHAAVVGALAMPFASHALILDFLDTGTKTDITDTVNAYRGALGTLNPNNGSHFAAGRREINWDGVPDIQSDPNPFSGNFFNQATPGGRARGAAFSTPGTGFLVSADDNPGTTASRFGFGNDFIPFSEQRIFSPVGSVITTVDFFVPGEPGVAGTTRGFGAVFLDVEQPGLTKLDYFGVNGDLLHTVMVDVNATSGAMSFAGALFDNAVIARVVITTGNAALLANGREAPGTDGVALDDFIYGEPVPEPSTWAMLAAGLAGLGLSLRRRH